jgi:DNA-binding NarL/FixJ family response regulator
MESVNQIRVIVADDHSVVLGGLESIFAGTEISVVAVARTGQELLEQTRLQDADLIVLDVRMSGNEGLDTLQQIRQLAPHRPVLVFSAYNNPSFMAQAAALGARGYLLKTSSRETILRAVRTVASGASLWSRSKAGRASGTSAGQFIKDVEVALTQREYDVLRELASGKTNRQIAEAMGIGYETVKEHVQHVLKKIGVIDRTQAALWAVQKGIL